MAVGSDDVRDERGLTALHRAVREGDTETAAALLDAGADLHASAPDPLGTGVVLGMLDMLPPIELDAERRLGGAMLTERYLPMLRLLLSRGADARGVVLGKSHTHPEALELLLRQGALIGEAQLPIRSPAGLRHLLRAGARADGLVNGRPALVAAMDLIDTIVDVADVTRALLERAPPPAQVQAALAAVVRLFPHHTPGARPRVPQLGRVREVVEQLLAAGAQPTSAMITPLLDLAEQCEEDDRAALHSLACLLAAGTGPLDDQPPSYPLHRAAALGVRALVPLLLARGLRPDARDDRGRTVLDVTKDLELRRLLKPTPEAPPAAMPPSIVPGARVRSAKLGPGRVVSIEAPGPSARAVVAFDDGTSRTILLRALVLEG